ncbi:MAG TPA: guanylate kinase [Clostridiales bacterium]|nr:guanylate kinase [Clostridiales bacterium]
MKNRGLLIIVSAPSGCGKGTILAEVLKDKSYYFSVSATTRSPREGEINGVNYHFISKAEFEEIIVNDGMLEYATYCDNYYGTPKQQVEEMLDSGKNVLLEIEVQGAMQMREICPDGVFIFINPPSISELKRRLTKRGTESDEDINARVAQAKEEMKYANEYDYIIENDVLENTIEDFKTIVRAEELNTKRNKKEKTGAEKC